MRNRLPIGPGPSGPKSRPPDTFRKRHGCVTFWLVSNIVLALIFFPELLSLMGDLSRHLPPIVVLLLIIILVGEMICLVGIFRWRKWAVYGYLGFWIAGILLRLMMGFYQARSIGNVIVTSIVFFGFIMPNIEDYE